MANKINEIIEALNGSETVVGLSTRVDNLEDELTEFEEDTNDNISSLSNYVDSERANLVDRINEVDEDTVKKTGDESISGNKTFNDTVYANDVNTKALTVHGTNYMRLGTVAIYPNSQGGIVSFKDVNNNIIEIIQGADSDGNGYLREYPNTYYPKDSNNNPVAPPNDVIMTSGLIGVDPRITGKATIDYVDGKINNVENPEWVLCDDVSSVHQYINPYNIFTKDVKIVFHLFYKFQRPGVINVSSGRLIYTIYFKKGDMYYDLDKVLPVLNGEYYPDDGYKNTVYFGITFNTLFYDSPNDINYNAYTEYADLNYNETKHHETFTLHRQNENLNYGTDSFVNVYVLEGEND